MDVVIEATRKPWLWRAGDRVARPPPPRTVRFHRITPTPLPYARLAAVPSS